MAVYTYRQSRQRESALPFTVITYSIDSGSRKGKQAGETRPHVIDSPRCWRRLPESEGSACYKARSAPRYQLDSLISAIALRACQLQDEIAQLPRMALHDDARSAGARVNLQSASGRLTRSISRSYLRYMSINDHSDHRCPSCTGDGAHQFSIPGVSPHR
jgi:hypothetical protein